MKHYTDICVGIMSAKRIGEEISHYLSQYPRLTEYDVRISRRGDGNFYVEIWVLVEEFDVKPTDEPYP